MEPKPYFGIAGFMSYEEVETVRAAARGIIGDRALAVGVLASEITVSGLQNKYPYKYPRFEEFRKIFTEEVDNLDTLNILHYSSDYHERLDEQFFRITELAGPNCHGLQLNICWPSVSALHLYKRAYPQKIIILQCGRGALAKVGFKDFENADSEACRKFARQVAAYEGLIDYVLIDASGGRGMLLNIEFARRCLSAIVNRGLRVGPVVAGGLCSANLGIVAPLMEEIFGLSIDAEGRLRDANGKLNTVEAVAYLNKAAELSLVKGVSNV